jgi:squalene-hopene/tetraprenyl-beta-curcumene cyclase
MQSSDGGWGAFEPENTQYYLNNIPFSDHGALLDPPTADVSGRCLSMLAQLGESALSSEPARRALDYMLKEQEPDGSWYGRWGMNYVYGTWTALCSLNAAGLGPEDPRVKRAAMAAVDPEQGRRLGRGRRQLQAQLPRLRTGAEHGVADRVGAARPDGRR